MPLGKPAGQPCVQLDAQGLCRLFGQPERPAVCLSLQPSADMCGSSREQALHWLGRLEAATRPDRRPPIGPGADPALQDPPGRA